MKHGVKPEDTIAPGAARFREDVHELLFHAGLAGRLGPVRTTVLWRFVVGHAAELDGVDPPRRRALQELLVGLRRLGQGGADEAALDSLMALVRRLDDRPRSLRDWLPRSDFHRVIEPDRGD